MRETCTTLTVDDIRLWLIHASAAADAQPTDWWATRIRDCDAILDDQRWPALADRELPDPDRCVAGVAASAAQRFGLDVFDLQVELLDRYPLAPFRWHQVTHDSTTERLAIILDQARRLLPLARLTTGPTTQLGAVSDDELCAERCLQQVVAVLDRHPGHGRDLLAIALRNEIVGLRHTAVRVLAAWPRRSWGPLEAAVIDSSAVEPFEPLQERMTQLLAGQLEPIEPYDHPLDLFDRYAGTAESGWKIFW